MSAWRPVSASIDLGGAAGGPDPLDVLAGRGEVDVGDQDLRALFGEAPRRGAANAGAPPVTIATWSASLFTVLPPQFG